MIWFLVALVGIIDILVFAYLLRRPEFVPPSDHPMLIVDMTQVED